MWQPDTNTTCKCDPAGRATCDTRLTAAEYDERAAATQTGHGDCAAGDSWEEPETCSKCACLDDGLWYYSPADLHGMCTDSAAHICSASSLRDAQLFEVKHLLILREQIAPFHVDFSVREISLDLSKIKTAAMGLVQRRSQLFALNSSNALLEFLLEGTPAVQEHTRDSKREVDLQLKRVCEAFIRGTQQLLQQPVHSVILRIEAVLESAPDQPLPPAETVAAAVTETQRLIKTHLPDIQQSMQLYLANRETEFILFKPVKVGLLQRFQRLQDIIMQQYSDDDRMIIMCPSQDQVSVLVSSCMQPAPS
ncbi:conserved oligomeric Golgi complex subunit 3-like [Pollicipes pollicipes]|uniref:conserved oligomeric Golgi complex subunit 3-like n=1 Tax=Pollicipes pollicipes TaxID=41117 RepID=UPI001884E916|nr:conserved oligomeric Golgi complex subunit 3-like [Pollicipes pollicipes]